MFATHLCAKEAEHRLVRVAADLENTNRIAEARLNIGQRWPSALPMTRSQRPDGGLTLQFENTLPGRRHEADQGGTRLRRWVLRHDRTRCRMTRTAGLGTLHFVS